MDIIKGQQYKKVAQTEDDGGDEKHLSAVSTSSSAPWWDNDIMPQPTDERMLEAQGRRYHNEITGPPSVAEEDQETAQIMLLPTLPQKHQQQAKKDFNAFNIEELDFEEEFYTPIECVEWYWNCGCLVE